MANGGRIDYTVGFKVNSSNLNTVLNELKQIKNMTTQDFMIKFSTTNNLEQAQADLQKIKNQVTQIESAYAQSFNYKTGSLDINNYVKSLERMNIQAKDTFKILASVGKEDVFSKMITQATTANLKLKETSSVLDKLGHTVGSTIQWGISSRLLNEAVSTIKGAFTYVKEMDTSLNNIRIVTGKSADEMSRFAKEANKAASGLGQKTKNYTDASLIYYQQGLNDAEVKARTETTLKAANVTGQAGEEVSEQLTSVWNGYKASEKETELYVDKMAAVAATTASDLEELSIGMSKVASAASVMGVPIDQLNAVLATTISVTRQAPESIGTAYKTIFARISDIEAGNGEVTLGQYTSKMKDLGFNILDANNKLRDQGDVITEIGNNWSSLTREQQISLAQTMAGTRQYNNLLALFDNWDMYTEALKTSANAQGTLNKQNEIYLDSVEAHLKQLTAAQEELQGALLDPDSMKDVSDLLKGLLETITKITNALGGGKGVLLEISSIVTRMFNKQIAKNIMPLVNNFQSQKLNQIKIANLKTNTMSMAGISFEDTEAVEYINKIFDKYGAVITKLAPEKINEITQAISNAAKSVSSTDAVKSRIENIEKPRIKKYSSALTEEEKKDLYNEDGTVNFASNALETIKQKRVEGAEELKNSFADLEKHTQEAFDFSKFNGSSQDIEDKNQKITVLKNSIKDTSDLLKKNENLDIIPDESFERAKEYITNLTKSIEELEGKLNKKPEQNSQLTQEQVAANQKIQSLARQEVGRTTNLITERNQATGQVAAAFKNIYQTSSAADVNREDVKSYVKSVKLTSNDHYQAGEKTRAEEFGRQLGVAEEDLNDFIIALKKAAIALNKENVADAKVQEETERIANGIKDGSYKAEKVTTKEDKENKKNNKKIQQAQGKQVQSTTSVTKINDELQKATKELANADKKAAEIQEKNNQKALKQDVQSQLRPHSFEDIIDDAKQGEKDVSQSNDNLGAQSQALQGVQAAQDQQEQGVGLLANQAKIETTIQQVSILTSNILSLHAAMNAIKALPDIWSNNDLSDFDKFMSSLTSIGSTIVPTVLSGISAIKTAGTGAGAAIQASFGWISVIMAALSVAVGIVEAVINANEKAKEARIEANKATIEENNAKLDEIEANNKLYNSYVEMEKKYKNGETSKRELLNLTDELISAYNIENGKLLAMTGNYEDLAEAIKKKRLEEAKDTLKTDKDSFEKQEEILKDTFQLNSPFSGGLIYTNPEVWSSRKVEIEKVEAGKDIFNSAQVKEVNEQAEKIYQAFQKAGVNAILTTAEDSGRSSIQLDKNFNYNELDNFTLEKLFNNLQPLLAAEKEKIKNGELEGLGFSTELENFVNDIGKRVNSDEFKQYKETKEKINKDKLNVRMYELDIDSVTSFIDYEQKMNKIREDFKDITDEDFLTYVDELGTEYSQLYSAQERLLSPFENSDNKEKEEIKKWVKSLSPKELGIMRQIEFNGDETLKQMQTILKASKSQLSTEDTTVLIDIRADIGSDKLKEDVQNELSEYSQYLNDIEDLSLLKQADKLENIGRNRSNTNYKVLSDLYKLSPEEKEAQIDEYKNTINELKKGTAYNDYNSVKNLDNKDLYDEIIKNSSLTENLKKQGYELSDFFDDTGKLLEGVEQKNVLEALFGGEDGVKELSNLDTQIVALNKHMSILDDSVSADTIYKTLFSTIKNESNEIITNLELITDLGKSLGDGFVVSADKVAQFAKQFPELLEDYTVLADGSIKLSQEQVNTVIGGIQEEQKARVEAQIEELDRQIAFKEKQVQSLKEQNDITWKYLQGEIDGEEYKQTFKETVDKQEKDTLLFLQGLGVDTTNLELKNLASQADGVTELTNRWIKMGAVRAAALRGEDAEAVAREYADSTMPDLQKVDQEWLDEIGSKWADVEKESADYDLLEEARKSYAANLAQIQELEKEIDSDKADKVILQSSLNAAQAAMNDLLVDELDLLDDVVDRYHDINIILEKINRLTNQIVKEQEKLIGPEYLGALEAENQTLDLSNDGLKKKREIAVNEQAELQAAMSQYGFTFNKDGTIGNYEGVIQGYIDAIRQAQLNGDKDTEEELKKRYDKVKDYASRYDELVNTTIPEIDDQIEENLDKKIENNIKAFNYTIQLQLDMSEAEKQYREFRKKLMDDDDYKSKIKIDVNFLMDPQSLDNISNQIEHANATANEIDKMQHGVTSSIYGNDLAAAEEDFEQQVQELMSSVEDWQETYDEVTNNLISQIDLLNSTFEKLTGNYDTINQWLENVKSMNTLVNGEDDYRDFANTYALIHQSNLEKIAADKQSVEEFRKIMDSTEEGTEQWNNAVENWTNATSNLFSDMEAAMQNAADAFENKVQLAGQNFYRAMSGTGKNGDFEYQKYAWQYSIKDDEANLDKVTKNYELDKLSSKIAKEANSTTNTSTRNKLLEFQKKELAALKEKDKLSQYDIDRANKKYEILQKTIALEEAQNNKSQMRLRRDSQGNYTYQYTANAENVDKSEQELKDAYQALYQLDEDKIKENGNKYYELMETMNSELQDAMTITDEEARKKRIQQIKDYYLPQLVALGVSEKEVYKNIQESATAAYLSTQNLASTTFKNITDYVIGLVDNIAGAENDKSLQSALNTVGNNAELILPNHVKLGVDAMKTAMAGEGGLKPILDNLFNTCINAAKEFNNQLGQIQQQSGVTLDDINADLSTAADRTGKLDEKFSGLNTTLSTSITRITSVNEQLQGVIDKTAKDISWTIKIIENLETVKTRFDNLSRSAAGVASRLAFIKSQDYNKTVDVKIKIDDEWTKKINNIKADLNSIKNKTVTVDVKYNKNGSNNSNDNNIEVNGMSTKVLQNIGALYSLDGQGNRGQKISGLENQEAYTGLRVLGSGKEKDVFYITDKNGKTLGATKVLTVTNWGKGHVNIKKTNDPYDYDTWNLNEGTKVYIGDTVSATSGNGKYRKVAFYDEEGRVHTGYIGTTVTSLDTGGYTGDWGSKEGRMAMLHEKELVLNKQDTKNILAAVQSVRAMQDIVTAININALSTKKQAMTSFTTPMLVTDSNTSTLDQNVHIEASFPNVQDARQIEEAFDNLVNMASQYANKQTR